ncbi:hypothetical protein TIFTF001_016894 [Ficus carica]|uniref:Uncharacterized protein n=1 Tax=Ficus carica TaxID=3494 RepID=A0AA88DA81_FICCA|nr:hypothetical protein TIFTF001_016894 [Ficus carica]
MRLHYKDVGQGSGDTMLASRGNDERDLRRLQRCEEGETPETQDKGLEHLGDVEQGSKYDKALETQRFGDMRQHSGDIKQGSIDTARVWKHEIALRRHKARLQRHQVRLQRALT